FKITFTRELERELAAKDLKFKSFTYQSKWTYGSPQENRIDNKVESVRRLSPKTVEVTLDRFKPGRVYQLDLEELKSKEGDKIQNQLFYYTANQLP
ncbi:MAG TPA: hypothetical protein DIV46_00805, partial [Verrucomicrobiales bacterium]|nr:hypothetical protein [Verrucomicrobiales bacterium]